MLTNRNKGNILLTRKDECKLYDISVVGIMLDYEKIHDAIRNSGIKFGEIAEACGISRHSLYKKVNGERAFKFSEYELLCNCLGVDIGEFVIDEADLK